MLVSKKSHKLSLALVYAALGLSYQPFAFADTSECEKEEVAEIAQAIKEEGYVYHDEHGMHKSPKKHPYSKHHKKHHHEMKEEGHHPKHSHTHHGSHHQKVSDEGMEEESMEQEMSEEMNSN